MASILKKIAALGLTIVAVVHQPRQEIFDSFDDLLLIAPGGLTAYLGPRDAALDYFKNQVCCVLDLSTILDFWRNFTESAPGRPRYWPKYDWRPAKLRVAKSRGA